MARIKCLSIFRVNTLKAFFLEFCIMLETRLSEMIDWHFGIDACSVILDGVIIILPSYHFRTIYIKIVFLMYSFVALLENLAILIHWRLKTPKGVTGKQCRPRSDATECGIWSGSPLFANSSTIILRNICIILPDIPKIWNGFQYIVWENLFSL